MEIEICVIEVDGASYSEMAKEKAEREFPGGAWKPYPVPDGSKVTRALKTSVAWGMPNWAYSFWREVKMGVPTR